VKKTCLMGGETDTHIDIAAVDNDPAVLDSLQMLLTMNDFGVRTYDDAQAFLNEVDQWMPHCLILEPNLQGLNGAFIARRIAANNLFIPIVALTSHPDSESTKELVEVGVHSLLPKPAAADVLLSRVSAALFDQWGLRA
jgi:FixJ family two-component response regulator